MESTQLILDFVARTAWPLVCLALGMAFRKPIKAALEDGTLLRLKIGASGVDAEWAVRENVAQVEESLTKDADKVGQQRTETDSPSPSAKNSERTPRNPKGPAERDTPSSPARTPIQVATDPRIMILNSAEVLRRGLTEALRKVIKMESKQLEGISFSSLPICLKLARSYGLLDSDEYVAGRRLAETRNQIAHADETIFVDWSTATSYARSVESLVERAKTRSAEVSGS